MLALPWGGLYKYTIGEYEPTMKYSSIFKLFGASVPVISKVLMGIALAGVAASIVLFVVGYFANKKGKLLNFVSTLTLLVTLALLILCPLFKNSGAIYKEWLDFLTLPVGLAIIYDAVAMGLSFKEYRGKK